MLVAFGVSLWLCALNVRFRDVRQRWTPLLQIWLFASPVGLSRARCCPGWHALVYGLNPMAGVIGLARWSLVGAPWPGWPLAASLISSAGHADRRAGLFPPGRNAGSPT